MLILKMTQKGNYCPNVVWKSNSVIASVKQVTLETFILKNYIEKYAQRYNAANYIFSWAEEASHALLLPPQKLHRSIVQSSYFLIKYFETLWLFGLLIYFLSNRDISRTWSAKIKIVREVLWSKIFLRIFQVKIVSIHLGLSHMKFSSACDTSYIFP